jgi:hypothetical protein
VVEAAANAAPLVAAKVRAMAEAIRVLEFMISTFLWFGRMGEAGRRIVAFGGIRPRR